MLFAVNKITDEAGNIAFTSGFTDGENSYETLDIDITPASKPDLMVERLNLFLVKLPSGIGMF